MGNQRAKQIKSRVEPINTKLIVAHVHMGMWDSGKTGWGRVGDTVFQLWN